jgi:tetratricopeptide (TPR) repeat protein
MKIAIHTVSRAACLPRRHVVNACRCAVLTVSLLTPHLAPAAIKPFADVKLLAEQGNYKDAASELERMLKLNRDSDAAKQLDFYEVGMLDAECQFHLGARKAALKAADAAIDAADAADDQDRTARATALQIMIDRAKDNTYTPRTGDNRAPISILTAASRETAMPFILADELDAFRQSKWKAKAKLSLTPALQAAKHFAGVRAIEHLVTGKTDESEQLGVQASQDVNALVSDWVKDRNHDLDRIAKAAAVKVQRVQMAVRGARVVNVPAGLGDARKTVEGVVSDCNQMPDALATISKGFGGSLQLDGLYRSADDLKQRAQDLLDKYPN